MSNLRAFTMPKWGIEMTEGTLTEWSLEPGSPFKKGDVLAHIETDKINNEVAAEFNGVLCRQVASVGQTLPVGALIAVLGTDSASVSTADVEAFINEFGGIRGAPAANSGGKVAPSAASLPAAAESSIETSTTLMSPAARIRVRALGLDPSKIRGSGRNGRLTLQDVVQASIPRAEIAKRPPIQSIAVPAEFGAPYASPRAARLIAENEIDPRTLMPTGPRGRISRSDVLARLNTDGAPTGSVRSDGAPTVRRMSGMRRAIAQRLTQSKTQIPHFYLRTQVRVDALVDMREAARRSTGKAPSINDYLVRAVALALLDVPGVNIQVHGDDIHQFPNADIAVAVSTDSGLMTPIVFVAQSKAVATISGEISALAAAARAGKLRTEQVKGGTFTISNLGMYGIDEFDAIINPPQGAILAVGALRRRPVDIQHALACANTINLSLSCDHRAIDGAVGAQFMAILRQRLEDPSSLTR